MSRRADRVLPRETPSPVRRGGLSAGASRSLQQGTLPTGLVGTVLVLLLGVPSELIVAPLGAAGTPAQIVGVGLLVLWAGARVSRLRADGNRPANPICWLVLALAAAMVLSYVVGASRPMRAAAEGLSSDRAMISLAAWCGIALALATGLATLDRLTTALRILAGGVVVIAVLGILQFAVGLDIARLFAIPGLTANHPVGALIERANFRRITGTTDHPIEFGVVLSAVLPLVVHHARFGRREHRRIWWVGAAVVAGALPLALARSGILGAVIVALFVVPTLPSRLRAKLLALVAAGTLGLSFVVPGLIGTLRGLVLNVGSDPSTTGRTDDYAPVWHYVTASPWLGRGPGTFIPSLYRTLDNQYLGTAVETGVVGLLALLALFAGSIATAFWVRSRSDDPRVRDLSVCLAGGVCAIGVNCATFDLFGFAMAIGVLFVLVGAVGALASITATPRSPAPEAHAVGHTRRHGPSRRQVTTSALMLLLCLPALVGAIVTARTPPAWVGIGYVVVAPPLPNGDGGDVRAAGSANSAASVLHDAMEGPDVRARLAAEGVPDYTVAVGDGSLMAGTDQQGTGPTLAFSVQVASEDAARSDLASVVAMATTRLGTLQQQVGVPDDIALRIDDVTLAPPYLVHGRATRAFAGLLVLTVMCGAAASSVARPRSRPRRRVPAAGPVSVTTGTTA